MTPAQWSRLGPMCCYHILFKVRDISFHVEFIQKPIGNFSDRLDDFSLEEQVLLFIQSPFLVKNVTTS